jgi:hypothetical protein
MATPTEHRQHATQCLELANAAADVYVKMALMELAQAFDKKADHLQSKKTVNHNEVKPRLSKLRAPSRYR